MVIAVSTRGNPSVAAKLGSLVRVVDWVRAPGRSTNMDRDSSQDLLAAFDDVGEDLLAAVDDVIDVDFADLEH